MMKDNLVSQQMVIDVLENIDCSDGVGLSALKCDVINDAITAIKALPYKKENMVKTNYCPNYGTRMDGEQNV